MKRLSILFIFCFIFCSFFISVKADTFVSETQKQIIRDTKRLSDLTSFKKYIEDYKANNNYYPKLDNNNIKGYGNSVLKDQWESFCSLLGMSSCPVDPLNDVINCSCAIFSSCSGNDSDPNIDKATCYNSKTQSFSCATGSHIYQYKVLNNGRNYSFDMEFEYSDNVNWNVSASDNLISTSGGCSSDSKFYKIFSNKASICGDGALSLNEECEGGSKKMEFCNTSDGKKGVKYTPCSGSCVWDFSKTSSCINIGFCGDSVIQADKNEECDGGYQKMCYEFDANSKHDWYNEQIRYCNLACKWDKKIIEGTAYCGGYCGDGYIQKDQGEECDDLSNVHCDNKTCKFKNSSPEIVFDFFDNRNSSSSYIKSDVWTGNNLQYQNRYLDASNVDLIIADKQGSDYVAIWNSSYIEIKVGASDINGDVLYYKYSLDQSYNSGIKIKYKNSSQAFVDYTPDSYVPSNVIRIYPTSISSGTNTKNILGNFVFGPSYNGFYNLKVTVSDLYSYGVSTPTNLLNAYDEHDIKFKIGPGCGDGVLDKTLGESCELKSNQTQNNIFTNWNNSSPSNSSGNYCAVSSTVDNGKWKDVSCDLNYYGLCERRASFGCVGWINGIGDNCYSFTSKVQNFSDAEKECESYNGKLAVVDDILEFNFLKSSSAVISKDIFWLGYYLNNSVWSAEYDGKWNPSLDYKNAFRDKFYAVGNGIDNYNKYSCGLPWANGACRSTGGYCGDGVYSPMFEECDYSDKASYGKGSSQFSPYECIDKKFSCNTTLSANYYRNKTYSCNYLPLDVVNNPDSLNCRLSGGYCGDGYVEAKYEHCDPKDRIIPGTSSHDTFGINPTSREYICKSVNDYSDYRSNPYNDIDDSSSTKNNDVDRACRKSHGGYCGDGSVQMFYSFDSNNNYTIVSGNTDAQSGNLWKKILYDESLNKNYFLNGTDKTYFTTDQEDMFLEECDPGSFIAPIPSTSSKVYQYGNCGSDNNSTDLCVRHYDAYGNLVSYSGNCACKKLMGGYCGDNYLQGSYGETCDPGANLLGLTDHVKQFCTSCMKMDCSSGSNIASSSVYLSRGNVTVGVYTGALAIMNALSAANNNDVIFVGGNSFDFDNNYSIDLNNRNVTINSCASTVWNWK